MRPLPLSGLALACILITGGAAFSQNDGLAAERQKLAELKQQLLAEKRALEIERKQLSKERSQFEKQKTADARRTTGPAQGGAAAEKAVQESELKQHPIISFLDKHLTVQNSFSEDKNATNPARFGLTHSPGVGTYYNIDAAVMLTSPEFNTGEIIFDYPLSWFVEPTFEAHVSNNPKQTQNSLTYSVPIVLNLGNLKIPDMDQPPDQDPNQDIDGKDVAQPPHRFITLHQLYISPSFQTNQEQDTQVFFSSLYWTPTIPDLAVGKAFMSADRNFIFRWRPALGFEFGHYVDDQAATEPVVARSLIRLNAEIRLFKRLAFTAAYTNRLNMIGSPLGYNYVEFSSIVILDPVVEVDNVNHLTVGLTWKKGKDAPDFQDVDTLLGWIGVQF